MRTVRFLVLAGLTAMAAIQADAAPPAGPPQTEFVQRLGAPLPLRTEFVDDSGRQVQLADYFGAGPVVLIPGYFHCANLCSTLMEGVLQSFADVRLKNEPYRIVAFSIDPTENTEMAARKKTFYVPMLGAHGNELHLLTGRGESITQLAQAAGFQYAYDASLKQYVHPAGFLIATADGHISRYFLGVRFDPEDVRQALRTAADGRTGSPIDRLLLLCAHFDPRDGRYSETVMTSVRALCLAILAALAAWIWRHRLLHRDRTR